MNGVIQKANVTSPRGKPFVIITIKHIPEQIK
jgi:hypothetical protein